jgi:hypothetical protein
MYGGGSSRNLGDPVASVCNVGEQGHPVTKLPVRARRARRAARREANAASAGRSPLREGNEASGTRGGKSELLVVPVKPGNWPHQDPGEGRRSREQRNRTRERCREHRVPRPSPRNSSG